MVTWLTADLCVFMQAAAGAYDFDGELTDLPPPPYIDHSDYLLEYLSKSLMRGLVGWLAGSLNVCVVVVGRRCS